MAPNRNLQPECPSTPYNRPKQFETARLLFKRMIEDQKTPMPTARLFAAAIGNKPHMLHSPPKTPEDDAGTINLVPAQPAPTPSTSISIGPCTPPPTLPRGPSTECPRVPRAKRSMLFVLPPPRGVSSDNIEVDGHCLGSPIQMAPVPFPIEQRAAVTTPRKADHSSAVAPWAPKRPSFHPSSNYGARIALRKAFVQPMFSATSSAPSTPTKNLDRNALVGRIQTLENQLRNARRELASLKASHPPSTPTRASRLTRRALKSSRPRPSTADSVFM